MTTLLGCHCPGALSQATRQIEPEAQQKRWPDNPAPMKFLAGIARLAATFIEFSSKASMRYSSMLVGPTQPPKTLNFVLLGVLAHFRIACAAATGRTIAQELLSSRSAINLADVNITFGIDSYHMRPVELSRLATAASKAA